MNEVTRNALTLFDRRVKYIKMHFNTFQRSKKMCWRSHSFPYSMQRKHFEEETEEAERSDMKRRRCVIELSCLFVAYCANVEEAEVTKMGKWIIFDFRCQAQFGRRLHNKSVKYGTRTSFSNTFSSVSILGCSLRLLVASDQTWFNLNVINISVLFLRSSNQDKCFQES